MTTDSGANWVFVPIDSHNGCVFWRIHPDNGGLIPEGYWMDKHIWIFPPISHGLSILLGMMYVC